MVECRVQIVNRLGLHARAAAKLVRADGGASADAKSILSVLMLAASRGTELVITADGPDELDALDAVCQLISDGFGETQA